MPETTLEEKTNNIYTAPMPYIIAVGGGKGGVGKSFFSSNLSLAISRHASVCVIDLDLGASNLHTCLGKHNISRTLSDYLHGNYGLSEIVQNTKYPNLSFIGGSQDSLEVTQIKNKKIKKLLCDIKTLPFDYVILDLGAGTSKSTIQFFLSAHNSLILTSPDPTSIENAYRFLKTAFYQKILSVKTSDNIRVSINQIMSNKAKFNIKSPSQLITQLSKENPFYAKLLKNDLENLNIGIVVNQVRMLSEEKLGTGITRVCKQYFGISCQFYGSIKYDDAVWQSLRKSEPLLNAYPYEQISQQIINIAKILVGSKDKIAVV